MCNKIDDPVTHVKVIGNIGMPIERTATRPKVSEEVLHQIAGFIFNDLVIGKWKIQLIDWLLL